MTKRATVFSNRFSDTALMGMPGVWEWTPTFVSGTIGKYKINVYPDKTYTVHDLIANSNQTCISMGRAYSVENAVIHALTIVAILATKEVDALAAD